jgi:tRNA dimethylallyltransferase
VTRVLVIAGPTAVGKSALAIELAERLEAEIVSADSVQVYRGMDIGSAKPSPVQRARVPHHLIDVVDPDETFSAGRYLKMAAAAITSIAARGKRPLVVGGSGLYLRALLSGLVEGAESDPEVRARLAVQLQRAGLEAVRRRLAEVDPEAARRIHPTDAYRIMRALEVYELTGRPLSQVQAKHGWKGGRFDPFWIGVTEERALLYERIGVRCEEMVKQGLLEEVRHLVAMGYSLSLRPLRSLGYKQMGEVLRGERTLPEAIEEMKRATRRYAKRQLTWFRAIPAMTWFSPTLEREAIARRAADAFESPGGPAR